MAILKKPDSPIKSLRGTVGNLVYRQFGDKTVVSSKPIFSNKQTSRQRKTRSNFKLAAAYAKVSMLDPDKKSHYLQRAKALQLTNAYTAALRDYLRNEHIESVGTYV